MMPSPKDQLWHRIRGAVDGYAFEIVRLIGESYSSDTVQQAWVEFTIGAGKVFAADDPHTELFFSWLFHQWSPSREKGNTVDDTSLYGVPPTRAYLDRRSSQLDPLLRRYLENCLATSPSFYEVFNCKPYVGFEARNVVTGEEWEVSEGLASTSLSDGEIMFAHLVPIEGTTMLEAISPLSFQPELKRRLIKLARSRLSRGSRAPDLRQIYFGLARPRLPRSAARIN
jgi:hypothetical protein